MTRHPHAPQRYAALLVGVIVNAGWLAVAAPVAALSDDIVISEVYGGGGNTGAPYTQDFVELFNRGTTDVTIAGWSVQYASSGGFAWNVTALAGTIPAGGSYLIQQGAGAGNGLPLPTPDATGAILMSATNGKVALVTDGTPLTCGGTNGQCLPNVRIRDFVGYGNADNFEGTAAAPMLSNTTSAQRDSVGCAETDDNAADFSAAAPAPANSASPLAPCITSEPTPPTGIGAADPATVDAGDTTLLTVAVTPGANPTSTGITVSVDLTAIGGGASQALLDDGSGGDVTAADGTFSYLATVDAGTTGGAKALPFTVADAELRSSTGSIALGVSSGLDIHDLQGAGHVSPHAGQVVIGIDGIVTAVSGNGFWMNDPAPDARDATSEGIFVFRGSAAKPAVGAHVSVDGQVGEFRAGGASGFENLATTQLSTATVTTLSTGNVLPVTVIGTGGRIPPSAVIDDDTLAAGAGGDGTIDGPGAVTTFDPANDGIDFYESLEGMYVQVNDARAVGPSSAFGEIPIVGDGGSRAGPFTPRGGVLIGPGDFNPERIILDDVLAATPDVNAGDSFTASIAGVLDYSFANPKLLVTGPLVAVGGGLQREVTAPAGSHDLAVATFNVENLSTVNDQAKFDELAGMIIHNLRAPDLLAIEEIQDDSGATDDGIVTSAETWQQLIAAISGAGGPLYQFRQIDPQNNADGGQPGANIRVGFLYRTDRGLDFVDRPGGTATTDTDVLPTPNGKGARLTISPGRVIPNAGGPYASAFDQTRKPLVGEFRWRGQTIFAVANHFSSKGADHPLFGRFQPPVRFSEFEAPAPPEDGWRHAQAQVVNDFVDEILAVDDDAKVIVLGDVNDFDFSETVDVLTGVATPVLGSSPDDDGSGATAPTDESPVLTTLFDVLPANERYSYVFEGNSQVLDQILVSDAVLARDPTYDVVHVNSEFFDQASDHDPSVMRVAFQPNKKR